MINRCMVKCKEKREREREREGQEGLNHQGPNCSQSDDDSHTVMALLPGRRSSSSVLRLLRLATKGSSTREGMMVDSRMLAQRQAFTGDGAPRSRMVYL